MFLYGCGGEAFTTAGGAASEPGDDGAASATGGAAGSTGGASAAGGAVAAAGGGSTGGVEATGGQPAATGGTETVDAGTGGAMVATGGSLNTGGAPEVDAGCALVTHDNGAGQTWQDCVPLGTYDEAQAMKACEAWSVAVGGGTSCFVYVSGSTCSSGTLSRVRTSSTSAGFIMQWFWLAPKAGDVSKLMSSCTDVGTWN